MQCFGRLHITRLIRSFRAATQLFLALVALRRIRPYNYSHPNSEISRNIAQMRKSCYRLRDHWEASRFMLQPIKICLRKCLHVKRVCTCWEFACGFTFKLHDCSRLRNDQCKPNMGRVSVAQIKNSLLKYAGRLQKKNYLKIIICAFREIRRKIKCQLLSSSDYTFNVWTLKRAQCGLPQKTKSVYTHTHICVFDSVLLDNGYFGSFGPTNGIVNSWIVDFD